MAGKKTAIITGASGGIGAGLVEGFLREGYNVVATSREANRKLTTSGSLVLLDGDIGKRQTAADAVEAAINNFGTIDVLVNNAGIFLTKPFTDFTTEDFDALVATNLLGFFYITQLTVKEMLKQKFGVCSEHHRYLEEPYLFHACARQRQKIKTRTCGRPGDRSIGNRRWNCCAPDRKRRRRFLKLKGKKSDVRG